MKRLNLLCSFFIMFVFAGLTAQETGQEKQEGHTNQNKFRQMYMEFASPNQYRTASGAPGPAYYQNRADYTIDVTLDDKNSVLTGEETVTYHNNSPQALEYLWLQLDQNIREKNSPALERNSETMSPASSVAKFADKYLEEPFDGGYKIQEITKDGKSLPYKIVQTMMRIDLPQPLKSGESYSFNVKWNYKINNHVTDRARSGYEYFPEDGNKTYQIAQFFPRMAVYDDVEGWQNMQFWGSGEFALPFGNYEVNITVPADHIMEATGTLQNRKEVYSKKMMDRYEEAKKSFDKPVVIVTQEEAEKAEKGFSNKTQTWKYKAENVRDFAFTSSRKYILDMMATDVMGKTVMAVSIYPKEGNPLWEKWSTRAVANTLKTYSAHTFQYPYHKAVSVHAKNQGMEYPMICWNYGRPDEDGSYSDRTKFGMISVITHEVGHNFFPMIVNSDERQWGWMDEGVNTFCQYLAEQEFGKKYPEALGSLNKYPSRRGEPHKIVPYMKGEQANIAPIMSNPEEVYQLGPNAYGKPATALNILRESILGHDLFDYAFHTYAHRWMFKHPTPEDFFRTMEDASGVDLDWFWRGWFYTTDNVDIGIKSVDKFYITDKPTEKGEQYLQHSWSSNEGAKLYVVKEEDPEFDESLKGKSLLESSEALNKYVMDNFTAEERAKLKAPKYFYQVTFEKPGGLVMPLFLEITYADGTTEKRTYPVQIWRRNDQEVSKIIPSSKEIKKITVDPDLETADVNLDNNSWPKAQNKNEFEQFRDSKK
ncbi:aminopeptidase [Christiangramia fulva]|uniref:Aminopeptidase n=1 Tax=Christiangramia fulva TaxID=2126553 RepID=A0A2R3Z1C7_9FLAO|nr:M1 family metallopeptidase [Christiangramia fulva]AVR44059.1 aminopeptidase [Christiangramia fulva]